MSSILSKVLSLKENVKQGTDSFVDDIFVNDDIVDVQDVKSHVEHYGMITKEAERINMDGSTVRVLGLAVERKGDSL